LPSSSVAISRSSSSSASSIALDSRWTTADSSVASLREPQPARTSAFAANTKATQVRAPQEDQHESNTDKTAFTGTQRHGC
jgi:hypothetical protein